MVVTTFERGRLEHLRNHPLLLTPVEKFILPVITLILLSFGRITSTFKRIPIINNLALIK